MFIFVIMLESSIKMGKILVSIRSFVYISLIV